MLTRERIEDITRDARDAFASGHESTACPFPVLSERWAIWLRAFNTAKFGAMWAQNNPDRQEQ